MFRRFSLIGVTAACLLLGVGVVTFEPSQPIAHAAKKDLPEFSPFCTRKDCRLDYNNNKTLCELAFDFPGLEEQLADCLDAAKDCGRNCPNYCLFGGPEDNAVNPAVLCDGFGELFDFDPLN